MKRILIGIGILAALGAASAGCSEKGAPGEETTSSEQSGMTLVVPANTSVIATLDRRLSTETNRTGDPIALTTVEAVVSNGRIAVPAGSTIGGTLRDVEASGRASGRAQMTLTFNNLTGADGRVNALEAVPLVLQAESATRTDLERVAAGGVIGAVIGGIAGGETGAAIGAGAGVGAGVIVMLATQGDELVLEPGQKISVTLTSPMSVQVEERN
ncbi:MAG: hypothetical protein ABIK96_05865 [bacterium]